MNNIKEFVEKNNHSSRNIHFYITGGTGYISGKIKSVEDVGVFLEDGRFIFYHTITQIDFRPSK